VGLTRKVKTQEKKGEEKMKTVKWEALCAYIVETNTMPPCGKAKENYNLPFSMWFEMATRQKPETLVKNARVVLERLRKEV
jgi:hypothetical protein